MDAKPGGDTSQIHSPVPPSTDREAPFSSDDEATECCVICLGDLAEACEARPCGHRTFDYLCLLTWLQEHPTCPLCKATLTDVRHQFADDGKTWKVYKVPNPPVERAVRSQDRVGRDRQAQRRYRAEILLSRGALGRHSSLRPSLEREAWRPPPSLDEAVRRRRQVYEHNLYSLHVGSNRRQPESTRYRELTPQLFMADPSLVARARMWLRRELRVFPFLSGDISQPDTPSSATPLRAPGDNDERLRRRANNAEFLLDYIVAILKTVDIQGSAGQAEDMIADYLGREHTRLLLHELKAWLRSPWGSLESWDRHVQYDERAVRVLEVSRGDGSEAESEGTGAARYPDRYVPSRGGMRRTEPRRYEPYSRRPRRASSVEGREAPRRSMTD